jgi:hypothetical protein
VHLLERKNFILVEMHGKTTIKLLEDLWTIWSCCLYVFLRVLLSQHFFLNVCVVLFLFNNVIYVFLLYDYVYVWLPWLRFFRAFSSVVRQMSGWCPQRRGTARTLPRFLLLYVLFVLFYVLFFCCSMWCLFCDVPCIVCVYMCTEQLPSSGYPIAVKYIIPYHIIPYHIISYHIKWQKKWMLLTYHYSGQNPFTLLFIWFRKHYTCTVNTKKNFYKYITLKGVFSVALQTINYLSNKQEQTTK